MLALFFAIFQFTVKPAYASEVSITLTSAPVNGLGFVKLNGTAVTTPYTFSANIGDYETIEAVSSANTVANQSRYVWTSWSNGGTQNQTITVGSSGITYTANFQLQYYLNVSGGFSTAGQGWYNSGTSATASSNWLQSVQGDTTGLVGLWHLDEGYGTTVYDSSGNGNNGGLTGKASWTTGYYEDGVAFDGNGSESISIPYSSSLTMATQISVFAWVNLQQTIQPAFEFMQYGGTGSILYVYTDGAQARFMGAVSINDTWQYGEGTNSFTYGTWHWIGFTYDGQHLTNWIDGQQGNSIVLTGNIDSCTQPMTINGRGQHKGVVDEVCIYNRTLSPSEISAMHFTRMAVTNWQLDGTNQNPTRQYSGALTTSSIIMVTYHTVVFTSTIQYPVSFQPMDNSGTETITPSSLQIEINDIGVISVPELKIWLDNGTTFQIHAVIWENADVKPTNQSFYVVNASVNEVILDRVFDANIKVTDYLGTPISGAQVTFNLANGTTIRSTTGSDGTLSLGLIPIGTFRVTISYLGTTTEVNGDASVEPTVTVKVFASYPTFSLIGGVATIVAVGSVLFCLYRRSPALQAKIKGYFRVNYGAPFIEVRKSAVQIRFEIYFRVNWGVPFIMGFMLLLVVAAVSLSMSLSSLADGVAVYAFYALVVGIVLQLASFLKYRKRSEANNGSS